MKSKYKYVQIEKRGDKVYYRRRAMRGYGDKRYENEKEAAKSADLILIKNREEPVNIYKRK
jgi:hypothetical protein